MPLLKYDDDVACKCGSLKFSLKCYSQMHLYIEPLNGSIDVTSFFRRMQYTTQKIAFLF